MSIAQPLVGIVMGSDSDWPTMRAAAEVLAELGVRFETRVISAHRTPARMADYGAEAAGRGLRAIVAGAGGAAHLPGMLAAYTVVPVIGVPVPIGNLQGIDALLSIVQMPRGVSVATVAIGNAANAGLLAAQIVATADPDLRARLVAARAARMTAVAEADVRVQAEGESLQAR
jgi:5-(carboxyamino)imidazole ribonucleotide mutase